MNRSSWRPAPVANAPGLPLRMPQLAAMLIGCGVLAVGLGLTSVLLAQKPGKPPKEEVEEKPKDDKPKGDKPVKPPRKPGAEEEEGPARPRPALPADLLQLAEQTKNSAVEKLCRELGVPADRLTMRGEPQLTNTVQPLSEYYGVKPDFSGTKKFFPYDDKWRRTKDFTVSARDIVSIEYYEQYAVRQVDLFLHPKKPEPPGSPNYLSALEMNQLAEDVLGVVLNFHLGAIERGTRVDAKKWELLAAALRAKLLDVRVGQLRARIQNKDWLPAYEFANELAKVYPQSRQVAIETVRLRVEHAEDDGKVELYFVARRALERLDSLYPAAKEADALRERLRNKAAEYLKRGLELQKQDPPAALRALQTAEKIWPELPGLQKTRQDLAQTRSYPGLYVGVRQLPENMSPALAFTDSERQAVEMLFEGLVKPLHDPKVGVRYVPALAEGRPRLIGLGRQLSVPPGVAWHRAANDPDDGTDDLVTAADVHRTVSLLKKLKGASADAEWAQLLDATTDVDPAHIKLTLHQGHFDPLSLMAFKILPARLKAADDPAFAKRPLGSGPYYYAGRKREGNQEFAVFRANPAYGRRPSKAGQPTIQEIFFFRADDPVWEFRQRRLHLLLDLPTNRIAPLLSPDANLDGEVSIYHLKPRRIHFLAINHRPAALQDAALRKAIALSIDREQILERIFRENIKGIHRPLHGPFLPGTWANNEELDKKQRSFDPPRAKTLLTGKDHLKDLKLTLKYPRSEPEDPRDGPTLRACEYIKKLVAETTGIDLELVPRTPEQLRVDVEVKHDYALAYYSFDFANENYSLWPLFDPRGAESGGRNYLGYVNDGNLESAFRRAHSHRSFEELKKVTHEIDAALRDKMPLIPLWQLDLHVAIHNDLKVHPAIEQLDPLLVFTHVESWRLERK